MKKLAIIIIICLFFAGAYLFSDQTMELTPDELQDETHVTVGFVYALKYIC